MKQTGVPTYRVLTPVRVVPKSRCAPLATSLQLPKAFLMFSKGGGMVEPICTHPKRSMLNRMHAKPEKIPLSTSESSAPKSLAAGIQETIGNKLHEVVEQVVYAAKDLGLAIASAIMAVRETLKSKGLSFKSEGKYKQNWLLAWFWWYSFMRAMSLKVWNAGGNGLAKMSAKSLAADNAKAPFQT